MCVPLLQCIVLPPGTLRGVCPCLWSRGPATAEALRRLRSRGSHIDLADGLETGSPYFHLHSPGLALSRGGSLRCSFSLLSESALICSSFSPRRFILFCSEWLAWPLRGSLEQLDRPSLAGPPLQGTELAALSIPEASLEILVPLVGHLALWEPLPSVSHWVLLEQTLVL